MILRMTRTGGTNRQWMLVVLVTVLAAGCSNSEAGVPRATTPITARGGPGASSSAPTGGLAALRPCEIFTTDEAVQLGLTEPGEPNTLGGARGCDWTISGSHVTAIAIWDKLGADDLTSRGRVSPTQVGGHKAKKIEDGFGKGMCGILLEVSRSSSVGVTITATRLDTAKACLLVEQAAPVVERKLP